MVARAGAGLVLACLIGVTGCGDHIGDDADATRVAETVSDVRADAASFHERWFGSLESRQAAEVLAEYDLNGRRVECMQDRGSDLDWLDDVAPVVPMAPLAMDVWLMEPRQRLFSLEARREALALERGASHDRPLSPANEAAYRACVKTVSPGGDDNIEEMRYPEAARDLQEKWTKTLNEASADYGSTDDWLKCLWSSGRPIFADTDPSGRALTNIFERLRPPPAEVPAEGGESTPAWDRFLAAEQHWMDADRQCRKDVYDEAMRKVPALIDSFEAEHSDTVAELEGHWASMEARARTHGWSP